MADIGPEKIKIPENQPLNKIDLSFVSYYLQEYNKQFGMAYSMVSFLMSKTDIAEEVAEKEEQEKISLDNLNRRIKPILDATGLSLEPVRGSATLYGPEGEQQTSEMRLNLADGKKFVGYLEALDKKTVTESQRHGLDIVPSILVTQLISQYQLENPDDDRVLEFFGSAQKIIDNYLRLGLHKSVENLAQYLDIARKGYLREFLAARSAQILDLPGAKTFGPSKWHTDTTEEEYIRRWNIAFDALEKIRNNPKATELLQNSIKNLKDCISYAKRGIYENKKSRHEDWHVERDDNFLTLLDQYSLRLAELEGKESANLTEL